MNRQDFRKFLMKGGRSASACDRITGYVQTFEEYLQGHAGRNLQETTPHDLEGYVEWLEQEDEKSIKGSLWGIAYYYDFVSNQEIHRFASSLRQDRIERKPFLLKNFRGVDLDSISKLETAGIRDVKQMLEAGKTAESRRLLAEKSGLTEKVVLEFVRLSDLARIQGIKGIRARLYLDAGIESIKIMAKMELEQILSITREFVARTGFDGIPPLPGEAKFAVHKAQILPKIVEY